MNREPRTLSVGVMAHNEAADIGAALDDLCAQQTPGWTAEAIVVVCGGCTDGTEAVVRAAAARDPRVRLVVEERREGKASAVNRFLREASGDVMVLANADLRIPPGSLARLVAPLAEPTVGMTGGRPIPVNRPGRFVGFLVTLQWALHHEVALRRPKLGEFVAFRRVVGPLPAGTIADEATLEALVSARGYRLAYVPEAVVQNNGPETVRDFLRQRRRNAAAHRRLRRATGYRVSTASWWDVLRALRALRLRGLRTWCWALAGGALELAARCASWWYRGAGADGTAWPMILSTKRLAD